MDEPPTGTDSRWPNRTILNQGWPLGLGGFLGGGLHFFLFATDQAKLLELVAERVARDIEQLGRMRLIVVCLLHGKFHHRSFDFLERRTALRDIKTRKCAAVCEMLSRVRRCTSLKRC